MSEPQQSDDDTTVTNPLITLNVITSEDWEQAGEQETPKDAIPGMWVKGTTPEDRKLWHILDAVDLRGTLLHTACGTTMTGEQVPGQVFKTPDYSALCLRCRMASSRSEYRRIKGGRP